MISINTSAALERVMGHLDGMVHNAQLLMVTPDGQMRMYRANGRVFIVQVFPDNCGVEVFIPASASISLDTTLNKLDEYIQGTI